MKLPRLAETTAGETHMNTSSNGDLPPVRPPCAADSKPVAWESATDAQRKRALGRLRAVARSGELAAAGLSRADADTAAGAEAGVSTRAVANWRKRVQGMKSGERLAALLDAPGRGRLRREWGDDGADTLWRMWRTDWLREEAPDAAAVYRRIAGVAEARGWVCPPKEAFIRRVKREIPRRELVRAREGAIAVMNLAPYQTRSVAGLRPLDVLCGDGRRHDVMVEFPGGKTGRPCVWAWQDVWSRKILAWRAGESETVDLVRLSLHELIVEHGVPEKILVDSTRAASAKWLTGAMKNRRRRRSSGEELPGLLALLEIGYSLTAIDRDAGGRGRGRGRSKPVERALGDLARQIDTHPLLAGAYTGRSTVDRPETHRLRAAPWGDFLTVMATAVREHNARSGRQTEIAAGRSFDEAWAEGITRRRVRRLTPNRAAILLLAAEDQQIGNDGTITLRAGRGSGLPANRYHHPDLVERAGERVVARFDPADLHGVIHIHDPEGRYLCAAQCLLPVGFADARASGEWQRARKRERRAAEKGLAARRDMDGLLAALDEAAGARSPEIPHGREESASPPGGKFLAALKTVHRQREGES